jgi:hypothetical protein
MKTNATTIIMTNEMQALTPENFQLFLWEVMHAVRSGKIEAKDGIALASIAREILRSKKQTVGSELSRADLIPLPQRR